MGFFQRWSAMNGAIGYGMFIAGCLLVLLSIIIIVLNYRALYINHQNRKRGNEKFISLIFVLPQVLLVPANAIFQHFPVYPVSGWLLLCIALADPSIWFIIGLPVAIWFKK